jgi:hypothetical protein
VSIDAATAREVLALAIAHCPGELEDVLRLHREQMDSVDGLTRSQLSGPDPVPASVGVAFGRFAEALRDLAADVEDYAVAMDAKVAMA